MLSPNNALLMHYNHMKIVETLPSHHVRNLDHRVNMGFRENALTPSTFDVEAEDTKRCNLGPLTLRWVRNEAIPSTQDIQNIYMRYAAELSYLTLISS